jgi:hypothetical protein
MMLSIRRIHAGRAAAGFRRACLADEADGKPMVLFDNVSATPSGKIELKSGRWRSAGARLRSCRRRERPAIVR